MKSETRIYVYLLAIDSASQPYIALVLDMTRQAVNYHIKHLIKDGYIRPVRGSNPITYNRTRKPYPDTDHRGWSEKNPILRSHHTSRKFNTVEPATREWGIVWDNDWVSSGVHHHHARNIVISTADGDIKVKAIRLSIGKMKSSLTVWVDADYLINEAQLETHEDHATEIAQAVANELATRTGARFGLPEIMQDTHYAMEVPGTWMDKSTGKPELETSEEDVALTWMTLPTIIKDLRNDLQGIRDAVQEIVGVEQEVAGGMGAIKDGLENIDTRVKVLEGVMPVVDNSDGMFQ